MAKFCSQCGAQINDDAAFCNSCGAKVNDTEKTEAENAAAEVVEAAEVKTAVEAENDNEAAEVSVEDTPESNENTSVQETAVKDQSEENSTPLDKGIAFAKDKVGDKYEAFKTSPNRDKYIGFAAIGIVVIVVIAVILSLVLGGGYKAPIKDYFSFMESGDFDDYADAVPEVIYEATLENYDGDEDYLKDNIEDMYSSLLDDVKIKSIDYDILDSEKFNSDQLEELEETIQDEYEKYIDDDIKVSKACEVKVKVTAKIKGEEPKKERLYFIVAKVNGDWGVIGEPSSNSKIDKYDKD